jgi:hypothetical protein
VSIEHRIAGCCDWDHYVIVITGLAAAKSQQMLHSKGKRRHEFHPNTTNVHELTSARMKLIYERQFVDSDHYRMEDHELRK